MQFPLPPLGKVDLSTNEKVNAWNYFHCLAKLILNPRKSKKEDPCYSHIDVATMLLLDLRLMQPAGRTLRMAMFSHAFSSPCFCNPGPLTWFITVVARINQWITQAAAEDWKPLDLDFSQVVSAAHLENSDVD